MAGDCDIAGRYPYGRGDMGLTTPFGTEFLKRGSGIRSFRCLGCHNMARRVKIFGLMAERFLFFYSLCNALAVLILALLLMSWGFGWFMPPVWEWTGISLAGVFFLTFYGLL